MTDKNLDPKHWPLPEALARAACCPMPFGGPRGEPVVSLELVKAPVRLPLIGGRREFLSPASARALARDLLAAADALEKPTSHVSADGQFVVTDLIADAPQRDSHYERERERILVWLRDAYEPGFRVVHEPVVSSRYAVLDAENETICETDDEDAARWIADALNEVFS